MLSSTARPPLHGDRLVRARFVVFVQMHVEVRWPGGFDLVEELPEIVRAVLGIAATDHSAGGDVEGGKKGIRGAYNRACAARPGPGALAAAAGC